MGMANLAGKQVLDTYLSWKGRIGRGEFWAFGVALMIAWWVVILLGGLFGEIGGAIVWLVAWLAMTVGYAGLMVKRGHDRGRPAVWSVIVHAVRAVLQLVGLATNNDGGVLMLQGLVILYVLVDYAILPGQPKANRYGLAPGTGSTKPQLNLGAEPPAEPTLPSEPPKA
jgi:uncharacterized membrane protein YhaH (DUF805 family)